MTCSDYHGFLSIQGQLPRAELQPDQIDDVDVLENVVLPFHLNQRVGPQPLQGTIQTMLSAPQEDFKSHQLSDLVWILLRQQPTEDLFTTDKRALQVIGGKIFTSVCGAVCKVHLIS